LRQTVGVLPSRAATCSIAWRRFALRAVAELPPGMSCSTKAASTVPAQVRKSLALKSDRVASRR